MLKEMMLKVLERKNLTSEEMTHCMQSIMSGEASQVQIASFLTAMKVKGETVGEILAAAKVMRDKSEKVFLGYADTLDTCGTGGDGHGTFNISTAVAFITAAAGVKVVKHGNRSASSLCGSADVLEELGANILQKVDQVKESMKQCSISFLFAPLYHKSMKHVADTRKQLGFRTLFNILGPLANPAEAQRQVIGVYHPDLTWIIACVLRHLDIKKAMVVYGADGMDEISLTGPTQVREIQDGKIESYIIRPEDYGLTRCRLSDLKGGDRQENAGIIKRLFQGEKGPMRDVLLLNSAAALYTGGRVFDMKEGIATAAEIIDSGRAYNTLQRFVSVSQSYAAEQPRELVMS